MGFFSELSSLGFDDNIDDIIFVGSEDDILSDLNKKKRRSTDTEYLFEKVIECPCCGIEFGTFMVRGGKIKPIGQDEDLRPRFEDIDPLKYDAVMCPICGYAALYKNFETTTQLQRKKIREHITPQFMGIDQEGFYFTYDEAIMRYKMTLLCDAIAFESNSRRAYTCLKLSWVIRGKLETEGDKLKVRRRKELEADEYDCLEMAYDGFRKAYDTEKFPVCGMDEVTVVYLLAVLAYKLKDYKETIRYVYIILGDVNANSKMKDMARELRDRTKVHIKPAEAEA